MSEAISEDRLNDYVDGLLSAAEAAEIERLLATSREARDTVEFLLGLRQRSAELPVSIEPDRDLWPAIRERMAPGPLSSVQGGGDTMRAVPPKPGWFPRLGPLQWATVAAAAIVLVVTSSAITAWFVGTAAELPLQEAPSGTAPIGVALAEQPANEAAYALEIEQLLWALYENRERLDEDTISTIETNLRVIDRAIRSAREALEDDPQNVGLTRMLTSNYRHKLELLQRANRIIELS